MADISTVRIEGIREVAAALRGVSKEASKELRLGMKGIAEMVATDARGRVPRRSGKAASSIKARGTNRGAAITEGSARAPHMPWLDYGGSTKAGGGRVRRQFVPGGRYLYPAIGANSVEIGQKAQDLIADLVQKHNLTVRGF